MGLTLMWSPEIKGTEWKTRISSQNLTQRMSNLFAASDCLENHQATVVLMEDVEIREYNRTFRGLDESTDVLAFPLGEAELAPDELGDIMVSIETAERQAENTEHRGRVEGDRPGPWTLEDEITFLTVHGLLHLLGHDHCTPEQEATMRRAERRLWEVPGVGPALGEG